MSVRSQKIVLGLLFLCITKSAFAHALSNPYEAIGAISSQVAHKDGNSGNGSGGTGVLISQSGLFLTVLHNLEICAQVLGNKDEDGPTPKLAGKTCKNIEITFPAAPNHPVRVKGAKILAIGSLTLKGPRAPYRDWALLQLESQRLKLINPAQLSVEPLQQGEKVKIIGFPVSKIGSPVRNYSAYDLEMRESFGSVQGKEETLGIWQILYQSLGLSENAYRSFLSLVNSNFFPDDSQIFSNIPIYPGYSGGPILNSKNEVMGIIWGTIGIWDYTHGEPPDIIGFDPTHPEKLANKLISGIRLTAIPPLKERLSP